MKTRSYLRRFGDVELAVRQTGKGLPLVWGHGLLGSIQVEDRAAVCDWAEIEKHALLVRYDARGHGNSDGSYDPQDYRWPMLAADMRAIAATVSEECAVDRCVLAGLSMGAATALEAAVQHSASVAGLVLVLPPTGWKTRPRQSNIYRRLAWVSGLFGALPFRVFDWLPPGSVNDPRSRLAMNTARGLAGANPLHVQAALRGAALSDLPDPAKLQKLRIPTLIITWTDDVAHPVSTAEALCELLPDVHALIVSAGPDIDEWTPAICQFLDDVAGRQKRSAKSASAKKSGARKGIAAGKKTAAKKPSIKPNRRRAA